MSFLNSKFSLTVGRLSDILMRKMIICDNIYNIPMGFCSGNAASGSHKPSICPIIKRRVGSNSCPPFLFLQSQYIKKAVSTSLNLPHRATTAQVKIRLEVLIMVTGGIIRMFCLYRWDCHRDNVGKALSVTDGGRIPLIVKG